MTTVIDSLVVTLGLDPKDFKKGEKEYREATDRMKQYSVKASKDMTTGTKQSVDAFRSLKNEALALATSFLGISVLKGFLADITKNDAAMGYFAKNVGSTTKEVSTWVGVIKQTGGNAEDAQHSIQALTMSMQKLKFTGQYDESLMYLSRYVSLIDPATRKARTFTDIMIELSKQFQGKSAEEAQFLGSMMGLSPSLVNELLKGPNQVRKDLSGQESINQITEKQAKEAQERQVSFSKLSQSIDQLFRDGIEKLTPNIIESVEYTRILVQKIDEWITAFDLQGMRKKNIQKTEDYDKKIRSYLPSWMGGYDLSEKIAKAESGGKYNAVNGGKYEELENLTLNEVIAMQNIKRFGAAGKYQMMRGTITDAIKNLGLSGDEHFDAAMQERIQRDFILKDKRPAVRDYINGTSNDKEAAYRALANEFEVVKNGAIPRSETMSGLEQARAGNNQASISKSSTTQIGDVHIYTQAQDGKGIANDFTDSLSLNANHGLQ